MRLWPFLVGVAFVGCGAATAPPDTPGSSEPRVIARALLTGGTTCILTYERELWCMERPPVITTRAGAHPLGRLASGATDLACDGGDCCLAWADGRVTCWGDDYETAMEGVPVADFAGEQVSRIATGSTRGCALMDAGDLRCWDVGGPHAELSTPYGMPLVRQLAWSGDGACAASGDGSVLCWNTWLGDGSATTRPTYPVRPLLTSPATRVRASSTHLCAVLEGGELHCWGSNTYGALGSGSAFARNPDRPIVPIRAVLDRQIRDVAPGREFTCALDADDTVWCWGRNDRGQAGDASLAPQLAPVRVGVFPSAVGIAAGDDHACVWTAARMWCWGAPRFPVTDGHTCRDGACLPPAQVALPVPALAGPPPP